MGVLCLKELWKWTFENDRHGLFIKSTLDIHKCIVSCGLGTYMFFLHYLSIHNLKYFINVHRS